jgi:hypothetical protein
VRLAYVADEQISALGSFGNGFGLLLIHKFGDFGDFMMVVED